MYDQSEKEISFKIDEEDKDAQISMEEMKERAKAIKDFSVIDNFMLSIYRE